MSNDIIICGQTARLYPTAKQAERLHCWAGALRFMWNRFLEAESAHYAKDQTFIWRAELHKIGQAMRAAHDWIADVPSNATIQVAADFDRALRRMVRDRKAGRRCGFPRPKKRFVNECSIYCANKLVRPAPDLRTVCLPKLGSVKVRGLQPVNGRIYAARIVRDGNRWMLSIQYECPAPAPFPTSDVVVAVDLGMKRLATVFDGEKFLRVDASRPLKRAMRTLKRRQRRLSTRAKGSNRRRAQAQRVGALHRKIRNRRKESVHQLTHRLTAKAGVVIVEDLNVKGMARGMLAGAIADVGFGAILRTLAYKATWRGREVVKVDRFYPSSQICSGCGQVHAEMRSLSRRTLRCDCGTSIDRDENAAINLWNTYRNRCGNGAGTGPTRGEIGDQPHGAAPVVEPRTDATAHNFGPRQ